jgi:hypothetical protein
VRSLRRIISMKLIAIILALALAAQAKAKPPAYTFDPHSLIGVYLDSSQCTHVDNTQVCKLAYLEFGAIVVGKTVDQAMAGPSTVVLPKPEDSIRVLYDPHTCVPVTLLTLPNKELWRCKNVRLVHQN